MVCTVAAACCVRAFRDWSVTEEKGCRLSDRWSRECSSCGNRVESAYPSIQECRERVIRLVSLLGLVSDINQEASRFDAATRLSLMLFDA